LVKFNLVDWSGVMLVCIKAEPVLHARMVDKKDQRHLHPMFWLVFRK
jgi:hypothetical protein